MTTRDPLAEVAMEYALEAFNADRDEELHALNKQNIIGFVGITEALEAINVAFETLKLLGLEK